MEDFKVVRGLDGEQYLRFDCPILAYHLSMIYGLRLCCVYGFENGFLLKEYIEETSKEGNLMRGRIRESIVGLMFLIVVAWGLSLGVYLI